MSWFRNANAFLSRLDKMWEIPMKKILSIAVACIGVAGLVVIVAAKTSLFWIVPAVLLVLMPVFGSGLTVCVKCGDWFAVIPACKAACSKCGDVPTW